MKGPEIPADKKLLELLIARCNAHCRCFANTPKNLVYADQALARIDEIFVIIGEIIPAENDREWVLGQVQAIKARYLGYLPIEGKVDLFLANTYKLYRLLAQQEKITS